MIKLKSYGAGIQLSTQRKTFTWTVGFITYLSKPQTHKFGEPYSKVCTTSKF